MKLRVCIPLLFLAIFIIGGAGVSLRAYRLVCEVVSKSSTAREQAVDEFFGQLLKEKKLPRTEPRGEVAKLHDFLRANRAAEINCDQIRRMKGFWMATVQINDAKTGRSGIYLLRLDQIGMYWRVTAILPIVPITPRRREGEIFTLRSIDSAGTRPREGTTGAGNPPKS